MADPAASELARFLGPPPGTTYVYSRLDDGTREVGSSIVVTGLGSADAGGLRLRQTCSLHRGDALAVETGSELRVHIEGSELVQTGPEGDYVLLRAPLRVGTAWTRPITGYTPETGGWRRELHCRIALIETVPVFGDPRLTVRVVGRGRVPGAEVVLIEQHAEGIGLVLRREQIGDFAPSETLLEEIREEPGMAPR
jgi:hypothetical protein